LTTHPNLLILVDSYGIAMKRTATMAAWLTSEEGAKHLKIGTSKLYQIAHHGKVPAQKLGWAWRFDVEDLDKWMKSGIISKIAPPEAIENKRGSPS